MSDDSEDKVQDTMYKSEMASAKKDVPKCKRPKRSKKGPKRGAKSLEIR